MADRKPLVLDGTGQTQQLQAVDDLDIPLAARVAALEMQLRTLGELLASQGLEVPEELIG